MVNKPEIKENAILLIHCPDQQGILAAITEFINTNNGNILYLDQHVDREEKVFFMRVEWDLKEFSIPKEKVNDYIETLFGQKYQLDFKLYFSTVKPRMAIFVSKMSHCLFDLLARYSAGEWNVEIPFIVSNHPHMEWVANRFDIPYFYIPISKETKEEQEQKELDLLTEYKVDFVVLARYMQIISPELVAKLPNRIINIHHSFLPAFVGAKPYHAAHARGVKIIGATSHYVTADLDAGPIIKQDVAHITHKNTIDEIVAKGRDLEKIVLSHAVEKHLQRKILVYNNRTVVFS